MSEEVFTLADCPTPYPPFMEGAELPEIGLTLPLDAGEDLTGATVQLILTRDTTDPLNPDIIEKDFTELENVPNSHWKGKITFAPADLIPGVGQLCVVILNTLSDGDEPISRFFIDVFANPDPTP